MGRSALSRKPAPQAAREVQPEAPAVPIPASQHNSKTGAPAKTPRAAKRAGTGGAKPKTATGSKAAAKPKSAAKAAAAGKPTADKAKTASKAAGRAEAAPSSAAPIAEPARSAKPTASAERPSKPRKRVAKGAAGEAAPKPEPRREAEGVASEDVGSRHSAAPSPGYEEHRAAAEEAAAADAANPFLTPEVERFAANMAKLWEESGRAMSAYLKPREQATQDPSKAAEVVDIVKTLGQVAERWMSDPARVAEAQGAFAGKFVELWAVTLKRLSGEQAAPVIAPDPKDARFKDPEWTEHPVFDFLRQAYLHTSRWAEKMVDDAGDIDPHVRHKASFYVKLLTNAASPSNFLPTNPELIRETMASKGENLVRGMRMLAEDIHYGKGDLRIRQTDLSGFEVGRNLATTPGKVVYRNDLFELIQYAPSTEMVRARPVLFVPPWINKFYILDLTPEKSMIRWLVEQGLTVFCVSWVNPDRRHADKSFDDYMREGVMRAVDVAREISGSEQVDAAGYCVGGTLLAVTLAYMAATGDDRIASGTFFTTQVDFTHAGDLRVFVDEGQIAALEARMKEVGYLDGSRMANAFNMIRSNDMIFPYVVNNYVRGKAPFSFDLLYWNSDATRMPAANHSFYLRGCYLNNDLAGGRMEILGEILDLKSIKVPVYQLATREDHIAPAKSVFLGAQLFGGPTRFVLAGSGHIAGVVNPPAKMKYQHWVGEAPEGEVADWLPKAEERPGSWWPDWRAWLAAMDATMVPARTPGDGKFPAIEDAPGSYVKVRV